MSEKSLVLSSNSELQLLTISSRVVPLSIEGVGATALTALGAVEVARAVEGAPRVAGVMEVAGFGAPKVRADEVAGAEGAAPKERGAEAGAMEK